MSCYCAGVWLMYQIHSSLVTHTAANALLEHTMTTVSVSIFHIVFGNSSVRLSSYMKFVLICTHMSQRAKIYL